jgi:hypothetical protein
MFDEWALVWRRGVITWPSSRSTNWDMWRLTWFSMPCGDFLGFASLGEIMITRSFLEIYGDFVANIFGSMDLYSGDDGMIKKMGQAEMNKEQKTRQSPVDPSWCHDPPQPAGRWGRQERKRQKQRTRRKKHGNEETSPRASSSKRILNA